MDGSHFINIENSLHRKMGWQPHIDDYDYFRRWQYILAYPYTKPNQNDTLRNLDDKKDCVGLWSIFYYFDKTINCLHEQLSLPNKLAHSVFEENFRPLIDDYLRK